MNGTDWPAAAPGYADIEAAAARIAPACLVTPLLESPLLNERLGLRLLLKAEGLQRTGSFKMRGAFNRLSLLDADARRRGVVAFSSGNHAQAVAAAARMLGTTATIVMPADAPRSKLAKTRAWGAEIVVYDRYREDRAAIAARLAAERGLTLVPPFDDPRIIAGQGTIARELFLQARALGAEVDDLLVCCSGGGLIAGCAIAARELSPRTAVYAVEPEGFDDTGRSLAAGQRLRNTGGTHSLCDSLLVDTPGELTFAINLRLLRGAVVVDDAAVIAAMRLAGSEFGLVAEPGGAAALAAIVGGRHLAPGRTVAVILTGSNVDVNTVAALYARAD